LICIDFQSKKNIPVSRRYTRNPRVLAATHSTLF
jgi:hypothetical protein